MNIAGKIVKNIIGDSYSKNNKSYKVGSKVKFNYDITLDDRNKNDRAIQGSIGVITQIDKTSEYPYYVKFKNANGKLDVRVFTDNDISLI